MTLVVTTYRAMAAILLAATLGVAAGCSDNHAEQLAVPGSSKAAKLKQCVRPKEFMRRNHFELIKHQRDVTVHQGVRATTDSLSACIACHVQYDSKNQPVPVNAEGQFCNRCHDWVAVEPDCFGCHSTVPQGKSPSNLNKQWPAVFPPPPKPKPVAPAAVAKPVVKPVPVVPVKPVATPATPKVVAPSVVAPVQSVVTPTAPVQPVAPVTPPVATPTPTPSVTPPEGQNK